MGVLSDPSAFYVVPGEEWAQGDLVVAPTAALWHAGGRQVQKYPQPAPVPPGLRSVVYQLWGEAPPFARATLVEGLVSPALLLTDDCALDKEFNASVETLMRGGRSEAEAMAQARSDAGLDPLVRLAPVLPYEDLRFVSPTAVQTAQAIGYFPVLGTDLIDEGFVDFGRTVPVSRRLLPRPVATLSEEARHILRWKLAEHFALRNLSVDAQIMAAVGKTILASHVVSDSKSRLVVELELSGGDCLRLRQEPRRSDANPQRVRGTRG